MDKKTLCIATRNANKANEMAPVLADLLEGEMLRRLSRELNELDDIAETGDTFLANAKLKAIETSQAISDYVLADDSGLECTALDGAPGVFSARYGGIPSSTEKNNTKLLQELARVGATTPQLRAARFRCVLVLAKGRRGAGELRRHVRRHDHPRRQGHERLRLRSAFHPARLRAHLRPARRENEDGTEPPRRRAASSSSTGARRIRWSSFPVSGGFTPEEVIAVSSLCLQTFAYR